MPLNVIGLLNISMDKEEYVINKYVKLISREYFEKQDISMPADIRFYKTFIVSTCDFGNALSKIPSDKKDFLPTYFLWAIKLFLNKLDIINSSWFLGKSYDNLKEFLKVPSVNITKAPITSESWADIFRIDSIVHNIDDTDISDIIILFNRIVDLYKAQTEPLDDINLHWLYAFSKYQDCCSHLNPHDCVINITSALEFLLVNTSNESDFRASLFASLIYSDEYEERLICYDFMKWAFSIRTKFTNSSLLELKSIVDKSELPENISKLREILAKVLLKTLGLAQNELQEKLNQMIFSSPKLK